MFFKLASTRPCAWGGAGDGVARHSVHASRSEDQPLVKVPLGIFRFLALISTLAGFLALERADECSGGLGKTGAWILRLLGNIEQDLDLFRVEELSNQQPLVWNLCSTDRTTLRGRRRSS